MRNLRKLAVSFITVAGLATLFLIGSARVASAQSSETTPPPAWTANVCAGGAAIVFQAENGTGDGVTVKVTDPEQCSTPQAWYLVEPWNSMEFNPDAGCAAESWKVLQDAMARGSWPNGSAWAIDFVSFVADPMVVKCSNVSTGSELGLNPNEEQVKLSRMITWVLPRAKELALKAGTNLQAYCATYAGKLATDILCPLIVP